MAASIAEQVIARVSAVLLAGATAAGSRVYRARIVPLTDADLPAINITRAGTSAESISQESDETTLEITLDIYTHGDNWETTADALHMAAHALLFADATLKTLCHALTLTGTSTNNDRADRIYGQLTASYTTRLYTLSNNPATAA
jgi:hypothetical protein